MSNEVAGGDGLPGIPGEFHGRATRLLDGPACWVEVLANGGPRIVGFGLSGGPNLLASASEVGWDSGFGKFELIGGHRFWFAPESPECSYPDSTGLTLSGIGDTARATGPSSGEGVRLVGQVEPPTGFRREIEIRFEPEMAAVTVTHILRNEGLLTHTVAPWSITLVRPGGLVLIPQPRRVAKQSITPNQLLVLWPYAAWTDDRFTPSDGLLSFQSRPGPEFKIGCRSECGSIGYVLDGMLFVKRFDPAADSPHADFGCNVEVYSETGVELETLGPLVRLQPGEYVVHDERWELHRVGERASLEDSLRLIG